MNDSLKTERDCGRSEELLAYLYDETEAGDRRTFEQHITQCSACREEYAAFGGVRKAITIWRDESFAEAASLYPFTQKQNVEKRSALRAVQEFFRFAPVWLQASGAVAALVVCALVAFALVNTNVRREQNTTAFSVNERESGHPVAPASDAQAPKRYSQQEVDEMIAEGVRRGVETYRQRNMEERELTAATAGGGETTRKSSTRNTLTAFNSPNESANNTRRRNRAPALASAPRQRQPTIAQRNNEGVPRLSDLLDVVN